MNHDEIRIALETAVGTPEDALRAAVDSAPQLAPAVIAVAQGMADGRLPLPPEEKLLRFGLHALSVARETSACPVFLQLLRRPVLEVEWLFGTDDRQTRVARTLLGLFDGNDAAVRAIAADPEVDGDVRAALLLALARLTWEGRAPREAFLDLLDRFDRENMAEPASSAWDGWQTAIMLLGLTDWTERAERTWAAGPGIPAFEHDEDRRLWLEQTHAVAAHPEDPQRFVREKLLPFDDPVEDVEWYADPTGDSTDALFGDEIRWLDLALWRRFGKGGMGFAQADGFLAALAVGPARPSPSEYLPMILGSGAAPPLFDTPEHDAYVAELLDRHLASMKRTLLAGEGIEPWLDADIGAASASLWAVGYLQAMEKYKDAWEPLIAHKRLAERLLMPIMWLIPDPNRAADALLPGAEHWELLELLPDVLAATWAFWMNGEHPLLQTPRERQVPKIGRNEPCPCGSGKKYKRCCGAAA
jgi:uncharacterized protein